MENEVSIEDLLATADLLKKHIENLTAQIQLIREKREEYENARKTLESYLTIDQNEILVNIGADTFIYCNVSDKKRALIPLGSNIILESDISKAISIIDERIKDFNNAEKRLIDETNSASSQYAMIEKKVEEIYNSLKGKGNVQGP